MTYRVLLCCICLLFALGSTANSKYRLQGKVIDRQSGIELPFASVAIKGTKIGRITDENGLFELKLSAGKYEVEVAFVGYEKLNQQIELTANKFVILKMEFSQHRLKELVVTDQPHLAKKELESTRMSTLKLTPEEIELIPSLGGEADVIKVAQLLPGVSKGVEGSTDYFVRGGDADQNLVLLDGATVYNTGHLFGFMSVFNTDALQDVEMINGAFPADQGGRLSSILKINTKSTIPKKTELSGNIGLIASRFTARTALMNQKVGVMLSGRRTYIDQVLSRTNAEVQLPYYFYDGNFRVDYDANKKNKFFFSGYVGADILDFKENPRGEESDFRTDFVIQNNMQSIGWKHTSSKKSFFDVSIHRSFYRNKVRNRFESNSIFLFNQLEDIGATFKSKHYLNDRASVVWGASSVEHMISPSTLDTKGVVTAVLTSSRSDRVYMNESAAFAHLEYDVNDRLKVNMGVRQSLAVVRNEFYSGFEPRLSGRYVITENISLKASYSKMRQYMHRVSSSAISLPTDIWYSVTDRIRPQTADQFIIGTVKAIPEWNSFFQLEAYFKEMRSLTEYEEGTNLLVSTDFEEALVQGNGQAYGVEVLAKREHKKWQGWISYTLSWSNRNFSELNRGKTFHAKYDRRHNVSIVGQYSLTKRLVFSLVWEYISGARFTPVVGQYTTLNASSTGIENVPIYAERNSVSLSSTHRLDASMVIKSKPEKKFFGEWHIGVYNVYNRAMPVSIVLDKQNGRMRYVQPGLFGLIPSISYKFKI